MVRARSGRKWHRLRNRGPQDLRRPHPGSAAGGCGRQGTFHQGTRRGAARRRHRSRRAFDEGRAGCVCRKGSHIGAFLPREDPRDAFISHDSHRRWNICRSVRAIGTSSVRRAGAGRTRRPDLEILLLARQCRYASGQARCGKLRRASSLPTPASIVSGSDMRATAMLALQDWLPALAQGAIGIEIREHGRRHGACDRRLERSVHRRSHWPASANFRRRSTARAARRSRGSRPIRASIWCFAAKCWRLTVRTLWKQVSTLP